MKFRMTMQFEGATAAEAKGLKSAGFKLDELKARSTNNLSFSIQLWDPLKEDWNFNSGLNSIIEVEKAIKRLILDNKKRE